MSSCCPNKTPQKHPKRTNLKSHGRYFRTSDSKWIRRWKCKICGRTVSSSTWNPCFGQKKRRINPRVLASLDSGISMRRTAKKLNIHRTTVARKREFLSIQLKLKQKEFLKKLRPQRFHIVQFDELETFEHTKMKPLSVSMLVSSKRHILGFKVSEMPCKGRLAEKSRKKYGARKDKRRENIEILFSELKDQLREDVIICSDKNPYYPKLIKKYFPKAIHHKYLGRDSVGIGQGELKKGGWDPLFPVNHTFAMMRYLIKPLARKTWCTLKKKEALSEHLNIFVYDHNQNLLT